MVLLFNEGLTVGREWDLNTGFPDADLMLLTATLNFFLVFGGGAEGCGFSCQLCWRVGG